MDVPANATGWDLRLINVAKLDSETVASRVGNPKLVIRRDQKPVVTTGSIADNATTWLSGEQWAVGADFTNGDLDATSNTIVADGRFFTAGMGAPLTAGSYYIGVYNPTYLTYGAKYRIVSRGIGTPDTVDADGNPWLIPVQTLGFTSSTVGSIAPVALGDSDGVADLRDIAVYRITVPDNISAWDLQLTPNPGHEAMLAVRRGHLPNSKAGSAVADPTGLVVRNAA